MAQGIYKCILQHFPKGLTTGRNVCVWHTESILRPNVISMLFGTKPGPSGIVRPKQGLSPYICFSKEQMPLMKKSNPDSKITRIANLVSVKWKEMSEEERKPYMEESEKSRQQYAEEWDALSEEDKQVIREDRQSARKEKEKRQKLKKKRELELSFNKPKKPKTPYIKFLMVDKPLNMSLKEHIGNKVEIWKNFSVEEKKAYQNGFQEELENYKSKLLEWEVEMLKLGYPELLRVNSLKELTPSDLIPTGKEKKAKTSGTQKGQSKAKSKETSNEKTGSRKAKKKASKVDEDPSWMREE